MRKYLLTGLFILIGTNLAALGGVAFNRSGEVTSNLVLTERELSLPYNIGSQKENSGVLLSINWRTSTKIDNTYYPYNSIDIKKTQELIKLSKPLSFTFHRAFDCVTNPQFALKQLIDLKVDRILTSGLLEKAENGIALLIELQKLAKNKIIILPGSGINVKNAHLFKEAGFKEIHASGSKIISEEKSIFFGNTTQTVSNIEKIKAILKVIKAGKQV